MTIAVGSGRRRLVRRSPRISPVTDDALTVGTDAAALAAGADAADAGDAEVGAARPVCANGDAGGAGGGPAAAAAAGSAVFGRSVIRRPCGWLRGARRRTARRGVRG